MPGSPATSPNFAAPRYADTDTASFSAQVNAITDAFDANVQAALNAKAIKWTYRGGSGSLSAANGDYWFANAGAAVTLPSASPAGVLVGVAAQAGVSGASPVTVSGGGAVMGGLGLAGAPSSIVLGTPGAFVVLVSDGSGWHIIGGMQDTGWVNGSYATNWNNSFSGVTAAARVVGDEIRLRGCATNGTGGSAGIGTIVTFASPITPSNTRLFPVSLDNGGTTSAPARLDNTGHLILEVNIPNNFVVGLDGVRVALS